MVANKIVKQGDKWYVKSEDGSKNLGGPYDTEEEAKKRLQQVEYFKHNSFRAVTTNISKVQVRHETMEGTDYLVVPMVMLTEGVHSGSNGPLYYPPEELGKTPVVWNHKPIVVYHPTMEGQAISACDPDVINTQKVGVIMGAEYTAGKLKAEAWLNPKRLKEVDSRILTAIEAGQPMEISTGLFTDNDAEEGEWNGEKYVAIARNFRPDHLAILPDQKGACSLADGAGLLRNQQIGPSGQALYAQRVLQVAAELVANELSMGEIQNQLAGLIQKKLGDSALGINSPWVVDLYDDRCVYSVGSKIYEQAYTRNGDKVTLTGSPTEVVRVMTYKPAAALAANRRKESIMDKKKAVDALIANKASVWEEEDRDHLMSLSEERLQVLLEANQAKAPDDLTEEEKAKWDEMDEEQRLAWLAKRGKKTPPQFAKNEEGEETPSEPEEETEPKTAEEYIAKAPEGIRDMLEAGLAAHNAEKDKLITTITSNKACTFTKEQLRAKPLAELKAIASLAVQPKKPTANYAGQADTPDVTTNTEEPLVAPVLTFD